MQTPGELITVMTVNENKSQLISNLTLSTKLTAHSSGPAVFLKTISTTIIHCSSSITICLHLQQAVVSHSLVRLASSARLNADKHQTHNHMLQSIPRHWPLSPYSTDIVCSADQHNEISSGFIRVIGMHIGMPLQTSPICLLLRLFDSPSEDVCSDHPNISPCHSGSRQKASCQCKRKGLLKYGFVVLSSPQQHHSLPIRGLGMGHGLCLNHVDDSLHGIIPDIRTSPINRVGLLIRLP